MYPSQLCICRYVSQHVLSFDVSKQLVQYLATTGQICIKTPLPIVAKLSNIFQFILIYIAQAVYFFTVSFNHSQDVYIATCVPLVL